MSSIRKIDAIVPCAKSSTSRTSSPRTSAKGRAGRKHLKRPLLACLHKPSELPRIIRDIATRADQRNRTALGVHQHLADAVELAHRTVRPHDASAMAERTGPLQDGGHQALHAIPIIRVNTCQETLECDRTSRRVRSGLRSGLHDVGRSKLVVPPLPVLIEKDPQEAQAEHEG